MSDGTTDSLVVEGVGVDRRARTRRFARRGLAISSALVLLFGFAFGFLLHPALFGGAVFAGFGGLVSFLALLVANARSGPRLAPRGVVMKDGALLLLDGATQRERAFPLADITQGWWEDPDLVHLALKSGDVLVVRVKDAAQGEQLLRAAGVTAAERVLRVPLASAASQVPGGSIFGGALLAIGGAALFFASITLAYGVRDMAHEVDAASLGGFSFIVALAALLSLALYAVTSALRRREAVVGTDGVAYQRSLRTEFIPYAALASVLLDTRGVRLVRKDGRRVVLPTRGFGAPPLPLAPQAAPPKTPAEAQRRVLLERIHEAMASGGSSELAQVALDRLDRNGRPIAAWLDDLRKLLTSEGVYRTARISPEQLGGVIMDPAAPAERRVAAAVALSTRESGEARQRVRIAVQACADEDLRSALESAAEGEIDETTLARAASRRIDGRAG